MIALLTSREGAIIAMCVTALLSWFTWLQSHDAKVTQKVETRIVQRSEAQGAANAKKAAKARADAAKPGAADRLRKDPATCPDCR